MSEEIVVQSVRAVRKGRGRRPCEIKIGISDDGYVVLRTVDEGGISPLVALLKPADVSELCEGLLKAANALRYAQESKRVRVPRSRSVGG